MASLQIVAFILNLLIFFNFLIKYIYNLITEY